jgi:integrase/recombinase XerC
MIKDYLHYFYQIENHWLKTVRCYSRYITAFDLFLKTKGKTLEQPENVDYNDIEEFVEHLRGRWCCANTCNFYLFWIKSFFKFCYLHNIKALDYLKIVFAKKEKIKIEACCEWDIRKLITSIKETNYKDKILQVRDLAIVYLLVGTWLRVSELCNLKVEDFWENLTIYGKGWKIRYVPCKEWCYKQIEHYLKIRNIKSEYIFSSHALNKTWDKLTRNAVWDILRKAAENAWIWRIRPHKLRHTYATLLLRHWGNLFYIQQLLWHSSIETTQRYLTCYDNDLRKTVELLPSF